MIKINSNHSFSLDNVLFSFALASEATDAFERYIVHIAKLMYLSSLYT